MLPKDLTGRSKGQYTHVVAERWSSIYTTICSCIFTLANQPQGPLLDTSRSVPVFVQSSGQLYSFLVYLPRCFRPFPWPLLGAPSNRFKLFHKIQSWISVAPWLSWSALWLNHPNHRVPWSPCFERPGIIWRSWWTVLWLLPEEFPLWQAPPLGVSPIPYSRQAVARTPIGCNLTRNCRTRKCPLLCTWLHHDWWINYAALFVFRWQESHL